MKVNDGQGSGKDLGINGRHEAKVFAISESEAQSANDLGNAYNLNTDEITGLTAGDATLCYFLNDDVETVIIEAIIIGMRLFTGLASGDAATVTVWLNATGGDLISDASVADINSTRNGGSSKTLSSSSLWYKGKAGGTITGGEKMAILYATPTRNTFPINIEIPRGASIALEIEATATAGTCYAALVIHKVDGER